MKLYHATSAAHMESVFVNGLKPRGRAKGMWEGEIASQPDCVYLTDSLAPFYADHACNGRRGRGAKWMIVEVDTDRFDMARACADEDAMLCYLEHRGDFKRAERSSNREAAKDLARLNSWEDSLTILGTCAYRGAISPKAITRISIIDPKELGGLALSLSDQGINVMAHRFLIDRRKAAIRWLMGEDVAPEDFYGPVWALNLSAYPDACKQAAAELAAHKGIKVIKGAGQ